MKTLRNISTVIAFAFILAGISGCSGCNPPPEPASFSPTEGPETGGTTIRITGDKFDMKNGVTVKVGGKNATSVNVPSKMEITAMTPAGMAGESVSVVVTNNGNTKPEGTVTMSQKFTYTDATAPTITGVSPADGTVISEYEDSLSVSVPISITFSEDVDSASGSLTVSVESTPDSGTQELSLAAETQLCLLPMNRIGPGVCILSTYQASKILPPLATPLSRVARLALQSLPRRKLTDIS
ncbi:IPT/TIG domain-containing protein [Candidatus Poribacteria bacterium]|nr:IPT/TIG domain-containing protein [Candidatus Poribacteria bacterium]